MIKVFTLNKNNKIELTKEELQKLLDEAYWDGRVYYNYWAYKSPTVAPQLPTDITTSNAGPITTLYDSTKCTINYGEKE